jgi:hypothetical protein
MERSPGIRETSSALTVTEKSASIIPLYRIDSSRVTEA